MATFVLGSFLGISVGFLLGCWWHSLFGGHPPGQRRTPLLRALEKHRLATLCGSGFSREKAA